MGPCVRTLTAASALPAAAAAIAAAPLFSSSSTSYISKSRLPTRLYLPLLAPLRSKSVFRSFEPVKDSGHRPMAALFVDYTANDKKPSVIFFFFAPCQFLCNFFFNFFKMGSADLASSDCDLLLLLWVQVAGVLPELMVCSWIEISILLRFSCIIVFLSIVN